MVSTGFYLILQDKKEEEKKSKKTEENTNENQLNQLECEAGRLLKTVLQTQFSMFLIIIISFE